MNRINLLQPGENREVSRENRFAAGLVNPIPDRQIDAGRGWRAVITLRGA
jgi:hypothetical protein